MVHYPDDDTTDLEQPRFINTEPGKPAMQVKADQAKMSSNGEDIYLSGNVMVMRNAGKGRGETTMTTSFLHLIPDDDIAKTDKPVVITGNECGYQGGRHGDEQPHQYHPVIVPGKSCS